MYPFRSIHAYELKVLLGQAPSIVSRKFIAYFQNTWSILEGGIDPARSFSSAVRVELRG